jgi:2,4-dienoyl-CoA reductase-like NADH-dependent reductase (Old Yellow Enzyme family)
LCEQFTLYDARKCGYEGIIMGSTGYTKDTANGAIGTGVVDMIAIGRPYMSNPDLVERWEKDWPLAPLPAYPHWYTPGMEDCAVGYSDFPPYTPTETEGSK